MEIIHSPDILISLSNRHVVLDTNIFIDAYNKTDVFVEFFNKLKSNGTIVTTIDFVKMEYLKGGRGDAKHIYRKKLIDILTDGYLPINKPVLDNAYFLLEQYGESGQAISITDLFLGANLMCYGPNLVLLTKNTTDFPSYIFDLVSVLHLPLPNSIQTYGLYTYTKNLQHSL